MDNTKWGTPPTVAGDTIIEAPSSYQWITEPGSVEHFGIPGQVRKVVANVATPQPTHPQAGAVPLTESEMGEGWRRFQETLEDRMAADPAGVRNMGREHWLSWAHWKAACSFALGIKGGQHGADN